MKRLFVFPLFLILACGIAFCQDDYFLYWDFNEQKEIPNLNIFSEEEDELPLVTTKEIVSSSKFEIHGLARYVEGVKGTGIKFDGFSGRR